MTAGGLGTTNLPYSIYQTFFQTQDYGLTSAMGVLVVIGTIIIANFALRDMDPGAGTGVGPANDAAALLPAAVTTLQHRHNGHGGAAARAFALDASADRYLDGQRPPNTWDAYAQDWAAWENYTRWARVPVLSGSRGALVGFVLWLEHGPPGPDCPDGRWPGAAPSTIRRRFAGVLHGLRRLHVPLDPLAPEAATAALRAYRRKLAAANRRPGRGQAHPVDVADLLAMSRACPPTLGGLRDRAVLTIGFYAAARASDLAQLLASDIAVERNGLVVSVRVGKTTGESALQTRRHPLLCPRTAWVRWRDAADLADGPALRAVRGGRPGARPLSPDAVTRLVTSAGARAQLPYRVTCHSLRAGFATASYRAGWDQTRLPVDEREGGAVQPHPADRVRLRPPVAVHPDRLAALDDWVHGYNTRRAHSALGGRQFGARDTPPGADPVDLGVVREHPPDTHATVGEPGHRPAQEARAGGVAFIGEGLDVGEAGVVVHGDVQEVVADPAPLGLLTPSV